MRMIFLQWMYWFRLRSSKQWRTQRTALTISVVTGKEGIQGIQATYRHTLVGRYPSLGYVSVYVHPRAVTSGIAPILWSPVSYGLA